jgi:metal-responsive CopG/Arc/MetJ family transcriptional regulator
MTTIQMTLDKKLLNEVDATVRRMRTTRSALIRDSIRHYLKTLHVRQLEVQDRQAYTKKPVKPGEFDIWESEQAWSDD